MLSTFNKKIMILGAGMLQLPAIIESKKLNIQTVVVDYDKNAAGVKLADKFYNISTLDYDAVLEVAKIEKIDGIITICSDRPMNIVAKVAKELGLVAISEETALKATNKCKMRDALAENNVPIPIYCKVSEYDEYLRAIRRVGLPCISKPSDNSGSRGVTLLEDIQQDFKAAYEYAISNSIDNQVLIEEYMVGPEVSVEVIVDKSINIIQITDKITTGAPHFVEMGHMQPSRLDENVLSEIKKVSVKAIAAIGIDKGPAHVEIIVTDDGPKIVELGARLGGDYITTHLVPLSTGYNMVKANIEIALNIENNENIKFNKASAIRYFSNKQIVDLDEDILKLLDKFYATFKEQGEIKSSLDRSGFYILSSDSLSEIDEKIEYIERKI